MQTIAIHEVCLAGTIICIVVTQCCISDLCHDLFYSCDNFEKHYSYNVKDKMVIIEVC